MSKKQTYFLYLFVFICGAAVMCLEMAASRLMAPFFGSSIFVWGNIIGIVLIALTAGYYLGGRVADKHPNKNHLYYYVLVAGVYIAFIPFFFQLMYSDLNLNLIFGNSYILAVIIGSFITALLFFAPPIFLLGFVSPYAIRLATKKIEDAGKIAGSLYAFSTFGSIIGTFGASLLLVPFLGSRETIYISSFFLILISAIGLRKLFFYIFIAVPVILFFWQGDKPLKENEKIIYEDESDYNYIQVINEENQIRLVTEGGFGSQSIYSKDRILTDRYYDYFNLLPVLKNIESGNALIIGLASGIVSRQYNEFYPDFELTGYEIDPAIIKVSREYMHLGEQDVDIVEGDGRILLQKEEKKYDLVVIDAYVSEMHIPWHLATQEFFQEVRSHTAKDGLMAMNIIDSSDDKSLLNGFLSTVKSIYPYVYSIPVEKSGNNIIICSNSSLDFQKLSIINDERLQKLFEYSSKNIKEFTEINNDKIFTDNKAPLDILTGEMLIKKL
ncbi:MAG: fused MFS/spermidine synthase [Patescibacteria group bacterium]